MAFIAWMYVVVLYYLYVIFLFTVGVTTFEKGRNILGSTGFFMPLVWLVGALLPARKGSLYDFDKEIRNMLLSQRNPM